MNERCTFTAAGRLSRGIRFGPFTAVKIGRAIAQMTSPHKPSSPTARRAGTRYCSSRLFNTLPLITKGNRRLHQVLRKHTFARYFSSTINCVAWRTCAATMSRSPRRGAGAVVGSLCLPCRMNLLFSIPRPTHSTPAIGWRILHRLQGSNVPRALAAEEWMEASWKIRNAEIADAQRGRRNI